MAATIKISQLPAATSALETDQLETNQGGNSKRFTLSLVRDYVLAGGSWLPLTGGTLGGQLNVTTLVTGANLPAVNINQEWSNAATTFDAFKVNAIDTASDPLSVLARFQLGGADRLTIGKTGTVTTGGDFSAAAAGVIGWSTRSWLSSPADGIIRLTNSAQNNFTRLQFGGTTNAFPSIKRNSAALNFRLADDSADAAVTAGATTLSGALSGTTVTMTGVATTMSATAVGAGANTQAFIKASSTANLGIYYGTGAPSFTAAKGSLYSNTTATTTTTRLYVNTDGASTWANLTTSA